MCTWTVLRGGMEGERDPKLSCNLHAGSTEDLTHPSLALRLLACSDRYMETFKLGFIDVICDATVATVAGRVVPGELVCGVSLQSADG